MKGAGDWVVEIVGKKDGSTKTLGSGAIVAVDRIATVRHVLEGYPIEGARVMQYHDGSDPTEHVILEMVTETDERDAIAILRVSPEFSPECIAPFRNSWTAKGKRVEFCGFPQQPMNAKLLHGEGFVADKAPMRRALQYWIQISTKNVRKGMSGGPVAYDGTLVGLICESAGLGEDPDQFDTCWAIDASKLLGQPFNLASFDPAAGEMDEALKEELPLSLDDLLGPIDAPSPPVPVSNKFVGRKTLLERLAAFWASEGEGCDSVFTLHGIPGAGKSSVADRFLRELQEGAATLRPDLVIDYSFDDNELVEEFFDRIRKRLPAQFSELKPRPLIEKLLPLLDSHRILVILDALEWHQDHEGRITDPDLTFFIESFARVRRSKLLILSRRKVAPHVLGRDATVRRSDDELSSFSLEEARDLYGEIMGAVPPSTFVDLYGALGGLPQPLELLLVWLKKGAISSFDDALRIARHASSKHDPLEATTATLSRLTNLLSPDEQTAMMLVSQLSGEFSLRQMTEILAREDIDSRDGYFGGISANAVSVVLGRLEQFMFVKGSADASAYNSHKFIRRFFAQEFDKLGIDKRRRIHSRVAEFYSQKFTSPQSPASISEIDAGLDAVVHLCSADQYGTAFWFLDEKVQRGPTKEYVVTNRLGAASAFRKVLRNFFVGGDLLGEPLVTEEKEQYRLFHYAGYCESVLGRPEVGKTMLRKAGRGLAAVDAGGAVEIFRSAAYCAIAAGALVEANEVLAEAETCTAHAIGKEERMKLLAQRAETAHMTTNVDWKPLLANAQAYAIEHFNGDLATVLPRGTQFVHLLARTGDREQALALLRQLMDRADENGWKDIAARCRSLLLILSDEEEERRAHAEVYREALGKVDRVDLVTEIFIRQARYHIALGQFEDARRVLEEEMHSQRLNGYPYLALDKRITLRAASHDVQNYAGETWEKIASDCKACRYRWGLEDLARYKKDSRAGLI